MSKENEDDFHPTWNSSNLFTGTAYFYARYRPRYPERVFSLLREKFQLNDGSLVLDLGSGPGHLALELAPFVNHIVAIDPQEEMLVEGQRLASECHLANIEWILGESGDLLKLRDRIGNPDLTVMGRSFHWMNRKQTLHDLYVMTKAGGGVAIMSDNASENAYRTPWRKLAQQTTRRWLGEKRKAGTEGFYLDPQKDHQTIIRESKFIDIEIDHIDHYVLRTLEEVIGYLHSTSAVSVPVLGEKREAYEADLRKILLEYKPNGRYEETLTYEILLAWKR